MSDGRKYPFARTTAGIAATLTLGGLTFASASPASAAPTSNPIGAAQARADRLHQQADALDHRHAVTEKSLNQARTRLKGLTTGITQQQRLVSRLQAEIASIAVDEYDSGAGTSVTAPPMTPSSTTLLTNVTVVSADTDGKAEQVASSTARITALAAQRATTGAQVRTLATRERALQTSAQRTETAAQSASATVADLKAEAQRKAEEAQRQAEEAQRKKLEARVGPAVAYAMAQVGKAYVWGASGPSSFDCSGLTMAAWSQAGVSLPHNAAAQYASGQHISESELQPGDLVFYYSPISHVGMYIGNGQIVNALNPSAGIKIAGLHDLPYVGAVRPG